MTSKRRPRRSLLHPEVGQIEVLAPLAAGAVLPGTLDAAAVLAEAAGEALGEGRLVAPEPPDAVLQAGPVDPVDAAGVEVVLDQLPGLRVPAPHGGAVRRLGQLNR